MSCRRLADVLGGVDVSRADVRDLSFDPHFHEDYTFGLVTRGANRFRRLGRREVAPAGAICLAGPGEIHTGEADREGWSYWTVHVRPSALAEIARDLDRRFAPPDFPSGVVADPVAARLLSGFFVGGDPDDPPLARQVRAVAAMSRLIVVHATERSPSPQGFGSAVRLARETLLDRWSEKVTLAELESVTGIGAARLIREFKAAFGLPPHAWLTRLRVCRARAALLSGSSPAHAAADAGFADQAHMTRLFRRFLGYTPGALTNGLIGE